MHEANRLRHPWRNQRDFARTSSNNCYNLLGVRSVMRSALIITLYDAMKIMEELYDVAGMNRRQLVMRERAAALQHIVNAVA